MRIKFWGTRGSIPAPGKDTVRYGGNTPCLEVRFGDDRLVIFDAGTGIRVLGDALMATGRPVSAHIVIGHFHWDHIQGFPFFKPVFIEENEFTIVGPQSKDLSLAQMIADQMNRIYFPVQLHELKSQIGFNPMGEESIDIHGAKLSAIYVNHPGFAMGYRLDFSGKSIVYISDNEPVDRNLKQCTENVNNLVVEKILSADGDPNQRIADFARGADVLIHDATYTPEEYGSHIGWGHSHYNFCLEIAKMAEVRRLILYHHHPARTDDEIDQITQMCKNEIRSRGDRLVCDSAHEGMEISI